MMNVRDTDTSKDFNSYNNSFSQDYPSSSVPPGASNQITSVASTSGQVYHRGSNFTLAIQITNQQKQVLDGLDRRVLGSAVEIIHSCGSVCQGPCKYLMQASGDTPRALIQVTLLQQRSLFQGAHLYSRDWRLLSSTWDTKA